MDKKVHIIVVAGGNGSRFGADMPKQYCMLGNMPVLCHTIKHLTDALPGAHIITVVSPDMAGYWIELSATHHITTGTIVHGGSTRWESVKNAITHIDDSDDAIILIHDGARPLVDTNTVLDVVAAVEQGLSAVPVIPVTDSLRHIMPDGTSKAVDRSGYKAVVTPQGFTLGDLRKAYSLPYSTSFTDDASVMSAAGFERTTLVDSTASNIKITNPGDIALAAWYLKNRQ